MASWADDLEQQSFSSDYCRSFRHVFSLSGETRSLGRTPFIFNTPKALPIAQCNLFFKRTISRNWGDSFWKSNAHAPVPSSSRTG
jgi:hypothetical protein